MKKLYVFGPDFFALKFLFWPKHFFTPNIFISIFLFRSLFTQNWSVWTQNLLWTEKYFRPKIFSTKFSFWPNFFDFKISLKFIWTQYVFGPKFFLTYDIFWSQSLLDFQFFWTQNFWYPPLFTQCLFCFDPEADLTPNLKFQVWPFNGHLDNWYKAIWDSYRCPLVFILFFKSLYQISFW